MIGGRRAVALVARREVATRVRSKELLVSTAITLVLIAAIVLLPSVFGGGGDSATVAVPPGAGTATAQAAVRADDAFDVELSVRRVRDDAAARAALEDDRADVALVEGGRRILAAGSAPDGAVAALQAASRQARAVRALRESGADPADAQRILAPPALAVTELDEDSDARQAFALVALFLLYGQILAYGIMVANGVVEEKSSRIVEILLATIRPRELLAGKVLGIGGVAFGQLLLTGLVGVVLAAATGRIDVGGPELSALPIVLGWFVLGFALYACAYAMGGALVSRQEDVNSATTPLTLAIVGSFILGFQAGQDPSGTLAQVLSLVPLSAPLVMPVRMIAGDVPAWEVLLAVVLVLAAIVLVIRLAGRIYGAAVLRTGGRVSLRSALRQGS